NLTYGVLNFLLKTTRGVKVSLAIPSHRKTQFTGCQAMKPHDHLRLCRRSSRNSIQSTDPSKSPDRRINSAMSPSSSTRPGWSSGRVAMSRTTMASRSDSDRASAAVSTSSRVTDMGILQNGNHCNSPILSSEPVGRNGESRRHVLPSVAPVRWRGWVETESHQQENAHTYRTWGRPWL